MNGSHDASTVPDLDSSKPSKHVCNAVVSTKNKQPVGKKSICKAYDQQWALFVLIFLLARNDGRVQLLKPFYSNGGSRKHQIGKMPTERGIMGKAILSYALNVKLISHF